MTRRVLVLFAGCIFIGRALSAQPSEPANTVTAILKQYQDTMNKQKGCIFSFSGKDESDAKYPANLGSGKGHKVSYESGEFACDGNRFKFRMSQWGQRGDKTTTEGSPFYISVLWDGKDEYVFFKDPFFAKQFPGRLTVYYNKKQETASSRAKVLGTIFPGRFLVGYLTSSGLRADELLSKSDKVSLRKNRELIEGAECSVVDVAGRWGRGTIWFSSRHGGLIAKAEFHQKEGDLFSDKPLKAGAVVDFLFHDVSFAQRTDVWFTTGGTEEKKQTFAAGGFENYKRVFKLTQATPSPDISQISNYFTLADVAEGSAVGIWEGQGEFVWRNGKIYGPLDKGTQDPPQFLPRR